jgi:DNA (cytosine-5)-methyltransferase 1
MKSYYNEHDPFAAAWLRELIKKGLIADGVVDERSIIEVEPNELKEFTQCHFFAGIGGWSLALRLAGWGDERPVWTGSPPCQPFSTAGRQTGKQDERHLAPAFLNLIRECQPPTIFGEQVASAIRDSWFDDLQTDLEGSGYAAAMAVLPACSVGAPHKRERMFFLGYSPLQRWQGVSRERQEGAAEPGKVSPLVNSNNSGQQPSSGTGQSRLTPKAWDNPWGSSTTVYCRDDKCRKIPTEPSLFPLADGVSNRVGLLRGSGNAIVPQVAAEVIKTFMEYYERS